MNRNFSSENTESSNNLNTETATFRTIKVEHGSYNGKSFTNAILPDVDSMCGASNTYVTPETSIKYEIQTQEDSGQKGK